MSTLENNTLKLVQAIKDKDQTYIEACLEEPTPIKNDYIAEQGCYLIHIAIHTDQTKLVEKLIKHDKEAKEVLDDKNKCTPFLHAVGYNKIKIVKLLVESGVNLHAVSSADSNALHYAARPGKNAIMNYLLSNKDKPNIEAQDNNGCTPLHIAAAIGQKESVKNLVDAGAKTDVQDKNGMTALEYAIRKMDSEVIELLGAKIDAQDKNGMTALHYAVQSGNVEAIEILLAKNADVSLKNKEGATAFDLVNTKNISSIFEKVYTISALPQKNGILIKLLELMLKNKLKAQLKEALMQKKESEEVLKQSIAQLKEPEAALKQSIARLVDPKQNKEYHYWLIIVEFDDYDIATFFLNCSINNILDIEGYPVWERAAEQNYFNSLRSFLNHSAFKDSDPVFKRHYMHNFTVHGNVEAVRMVLDTQVDLSYKSDKPPLLQATIGLGEKNRYEIIELILNKVTGIDINEYSAANSTALHATIYLSLSKTTDLLESLKIFNLLVERGANIRLKDRNGETPLYLIIKHQRLAFIQSLLEKNETTTEEIIAIANHTKNLPRDFRSTLQKIHQNKLRQINQSQKSEDSERSIHIKNCVQENLRSTDYTYLRCIKKKDFYTLQIKFKEKNLQLFSLYCLLKQNDYDGVYINFKEKAVCLEFSFTDQSMRGLAAFCGFFGTKDQETLCDKVKNNHENIIKIFWPDVSENSFTWEIDDFFTKTRLTSLSKETKITIKYSIQNEEALRKCKDFLSRAGLQFGVVGKEIRILYPISVFLNDESYQQYYGKWLKKSKEIKPKAQPKPAENELAQPPAQSLSEPPATGITATTDNPTKTTALAETPFAPPEILALNQACQAVNLRRRTINLNKGKKTSQPQPLPEIPLQGVKPRPMNKGTNAKRPNPLQTDSRQLTQTINSVNSDVLPLQKNTLNPPTSLSYSANPFSFLQRDPRNTITDIQATPDLILYPPAHPDTRIDFVTSTPKLELKKRRAKKPLPPTPFLLASPIEKFEAYLSGYLDEYRREVVNPKHLIRAIYYRIIHALLTNLHENRVPDYAALNQLRNKLVHDFGVETAWDNEENRKQIILSLATIFAQKSLPDSKTITEICNSIPAGEEKDNKILIQCMNQELKHLKSAFKVFKAGGNKPHFFDGSQQYLVDSCLSSVAIISECVHILNKKDVGFPNYEQFLEDCRTSIRNPAMHRCESTKSGTHPQVVSSIFNEKEKETCFQLIFILSELPEFSEQSLKGCLPVANFASKRT